LWYNEVIERKEDTMMTEQRNEILETARLVDFERHLFKPYEGKRFDALVDSVRQNGVIEPIIVRPQGKEYEILSGHNRVRAAREVGLERVPAVIYDKASDEEANIIVTVTNLVQRGYTELSHSERAAALSAHHSAIKSQGKRTDLIQAVDSLLGDMENTDATSDLRGHKLPARELLAKTYGIGGSVVERYLRVNKLIEPLKVRLDKGEIPLFAAVDAAALNADEQNMLEEVLRDEQYRLTAQNAKLLRTAHRDEQTQTLTTEQIRHYLKAAVPAVPKVSVKLNQDVISRYFAADDKPDAISDTIAQALEAWFADKNK
jgi:ParB family chromosome partitioning protein